MRVGVIGFGYWGPNIVRNLFETEDVRVDWVVDQRPERLALAKKRFPHIQVTTDAKEVISDPQIDAVAIVTPVSTHFCLATQALEAGKHVLLEKPMAASSAEAERLIELAEKRGLVLMVGHTFIYTGAVRKIKELMDIGELGDIQYFDSVRINLGPFRNDIDVLWDMAPHDLSILTDVIRQQPKYVSATGSAHNGFTSVAYLTVHYDSSFLAHFHVSWVSPVKIRQILISGTRRMLTYNDLETTEKVRVYDRGVQVTTTEGIYRTMIDYRIGDMWAPKVELKEALSVECAHFADCVRLKKRPQSDGIAGLRIVKLLEAASKSLAAEGRRIPVCE
jgi:predicted dehydrogenase